MRKVIIYTECYYCGHMLQVGDDAVKYGGDIFCDKDCVFAQMERSIDEIEISPSDCDCEEEDYRDDEDE